MTWIEKRPHPPTPSPQKDEERGRKKKNSVAFNVCLLVVNLKTGKNGLRRDLTPQPPLLKKTRRGGGRKRIPLPLMFVFAPPLLVSGEGVGG
jgi:hypothetical protein